MRRLLALLGLLSLGAASLRAEGKACDRVLFVGDSITSHAPNDSLGWPGNWGMAATAREKDYVHLFLARLAQAQGAPPAEVWVAAEGGGKIPDKLALLPRFTAFRADLAVVQLGENDNQDVSARGFQQPYEQLLEAIRAGNPQARILCTGVWGQPRGNPTKDAMIRAACRKFGATFADLSAANANPANQSLADRLFPNPGVAWHPGDRGMAAYADALWRAFSSPSPAPAAAPAEAAPVEIAEAWLPSPTLGWTPPPPVVDDGGAAARVTAADNGGHPLFAAKLDAGTLHGRLVRIETKARAEGISAKPQPWNGVKLSLRIRNAEGQADYPQYPFPAGTFDWMPVSWTVFVPDNAVSVELVLGLEQVGGTVWFGPLRISAD